MPNIISMKIYAFAVMLLATGCSTPKQFVQDWTSTTIESGKVDRPESRVLGFHIETDKLAYRFGEPILLRGIWENNGENGFSLNRNFLITLEVIPWRGESDSWRGVSTTGHGIALKVVSPSGKRVQEAGYDFIEMGFPHAGWFIYLYPQEGIFSPIRNISERFGANITEEGSYLISATYFNFIKRKNLIEREKYDLQYSEEPWTGTVESNTIEIQIAK